MNLDFKKEKEKKTRLAYINSIQSLFHSESFSVDLLIFFVHHLCLCMYFLLFGSSESNTVV